MQLTQELSLMPQTLTRVPAITIGFAMAPSFLEDHISRRRNGKVERNINTTFAALRDSLEYQIVETDWPG